MDNVLALELGKALPDNFDNLLTFESDIFFLINEDVDTKNVVGILSSGMNTSGLV